MPVRQRPPRIKWSWYYNPVLLLWLASICFQQFHHPVQAHPPPPQANDIFGTATGCASALVEMDANQDGMIKRNEYLNFVNILADFLCVPPRPILDLEIQTVFYSIACLCMDREGFDAECCFGTDAAIWTTGAADAITRTEDQDSYLRAACLLTEAILGPQQCTLVPRTLAPAAIVAVVPLAPQTDSGGLSDSELWAIIIGALLLLLLCCLLCCCAMKNKKEEEEVEEIIIKEQDVEEGDVEMEEVQKVEPIQVESQQPVEEPPPQESNALPRELPPPPPVLVPLPVVLPPREEESDESDSENIGKKMGVTIDDDEESESNRRFGGQGVLPLTPEPEGVVLRHIEVQKEAPGEYEYPEREFNEYSYPPDEDSVQEFEPYIPDGGVYDPKREPKAPVIMPAPNYQRHEKKTPELYDPRKLRYQLAMGDGEVWEALAAHEEEREQTKENKFEWIVQGALDVLARAHESGELTKPKPKRAVSPSHMRTSNSPPPRASPYRISPQNTSKESTESEISV